MVNISKRLFKKEYAFELLGIAKSDAISARALSSAPNPGRLENVLYLVQQSVEKCIKSVLVYRQIPFPLVHDLGTLVALLPDPDIPPHGFDLTELNPFASVRRYEEGRLPLTQEEVEIALQTADDIAVWAEKIITA